jgi:Cu-processing system ATP-binding protein
MIRFAGFTKTYAGHPAVDRLTLDIARGEVVALLGPNGSGKTTTLKAAAGLLSPSSGTVLLGQPGRPASEPGARATVSFLPQRVAFPESLTGREVVEFYRRLRGIHPARTEDALRFASLNGASARTVGTYSGGMTQRLGLAVAILPQAPVLLLDEPTAALDPDGLAAFYGLVEGRQRDDQAVLFTSHQLGDVERLADRFAVLVNGRLTAVLTGRELADRLAERGVLKLRLDACPGGLLEQVRRISPEASWVGDQLLVRGAAAARPAIVEMARQAGAEIRELTVEEGRLDTFYRELVQEAP